MRRDLEPNRAPLFSRSAEMPARSRSLPENNVRSSRPIRFSSSRDNYRRLLLPGGSEPRFFSNIPASNPRVTQICHKFGQAWGIRITHMIPTYVFRNQFSSEASLRASVRQETIMILLRSGLSCYPKRNCEKFPGLLLLLGYCSRFPELTGRPSPRKIELFS